LFQYIKSFLYTSGGAASGGSDPSEQARFTACTCAKQKQKQKQDFG
jgi:hypothetical protein